jgi:chromosome segregation ATPase
MSADPLQIVEALVTTVRNLTSDDNYKAVASVFDEIPLLKGQVKSKDTELDRLRREINDLKTAHGNRLGEELALYCTQRSKLEEEKTKLSGEISTLNRNIQQSDATIAELNRTQDGLRGQLGQVKKSLDKEKERVVTANTSITELQQGLKAKDTEIDELKESLRNEKAQVSKTESQLHDLQEENTSLRQDLLSRTTRLSEVEGFATKLDEIDEATW